MNNWIKQFKSEKMVDRTTTMGDKYGKKGLVGTWKRWGQFCEVNPMII